MLMLEKKLGDNSLALEAGTIVEIGAKAGIGMAAAGVSTPVLVIGGVVIGAFYYTSMPEEQKEQLKEEIYEIYQNVKKVLVVYWIKKVLKIL